MRIEATAEDVRALLELVAVDRALASGAEEARRGSRVAATSRVPPQLLQRYESLVGRGRTPAVVAVVRSTCSGCHVRLPTMLAEEARRSPDVRTCPHCKRMLYSPEFVGGDRRRAGGHRIDAPARSRRRR